MRAAEKEELAGTPATAFLHLDEMVISALSFDNIS